MHVAKETGLGQSCARDVKTKDLQASTESDEPGVGQYGERET